MTGLPPPSVSPVVSPVRRLVLLAPARSPHDRPPSAVVLPRRRPLPPLAPAPIPPPVPTTVRPPPSVSPVVSPVRRLVLLAPARSPHDRPPSSIGVARRLARPLPAALSSSSPPPSPRLSPPPPRAPSPSPQSA